jgi:hypothetical protein
MGMALLLAGAGCFPQSNMTTAAGMLKALYDRLLFPDVLRWHEEIVVIGLSIEDTPKKSCHRHPSGRKT